MQRNFNMADKALAVTAFLFVGFLVLKVNYPQNLYIKGLLFCTEAALVGGVADWFAVTALFKKPLGFPYHTEIIPQKRSQVIDGCIKLVQTEFFTKKQVVLWAKESSFIDYIIAYIEKNNYQSKIAGFLLTYFEKVLTLKPKDINTLNALKVIYSRLAMQDKYKAVSATLETIKKEQQQKQ